MAMEADRRGEIIDIARMLSAAIAKREASEAAVLRRLLDGLLPSASALVRTAKGTELEHQVSALMGSLYVDRMEDLVGKAVPNAYQMGMHAAEQMGKIGGVTISGAWDVVDQDRVRSLLTYDYSLVKNISDEFKGRIALTMGAGEAAGATTKEVAKGLISQGLENHPVWSTLEKRSMAIARTELARAANLATVEKFSPITQRFEWVAICDDRICSDCRRRDGKIMTLAEWRAYRANGDRFVGICPLHPHCRCMLIPVIEGITQPMTTPAPAPLPVEEEPVVPQPVEPPPPPRKPTTGVHFERLVSEVLEAHTERILEGLSHGGILDYLEKTPLASLNLPKTATLVVRGRRRQYNGYYLLGARDLHVTAARQPGTFGDTLRPGKSWSVSICGADAIEASQRTLVHEVAHHLHLTGGPVVDKMITETYTSNMANPITEYAATQAAEYFAETVAAYFYHRNELAAHDPAGLKLVERVFKELGIQ